MAVIWVSIVKTSWFEKHFVFLKRKKKTMCSEFLLFTQKVLLYISWKFGNKIGRFWKVIASNPFLRIKEMSVKGKNFPTFPFFIFSSFWPIFHFSEYYAVSTSTFAQCSILTQKLYWTLFFKSKNQAAPCETNGAKSLTLKWLFIKAFIASKLKFYHTIWWKPYQKKWKLEWWDIYSRHCWWWICKKISINFYKVNHTFFMFIEKIIQYE